MALTAEQERTYCKYASMVLIVVAGFYLYKQFYPTKPIDESYGSPPLGDGILHGTASFRGPTDFTRELQGVLAADGFYGVQNIPKPSIPFRPNKLQPGPGPQPGPPSPKESYVNAFSTPSLNLLKTDSNAFTSPSPLSATSGTTSRIF